MQAYLLPKHVFVCMLDRCAIILDLKRNQYLALDSMTAKHLEVILKGTSEHPMFNKSSNIPGETVSVASDLVARDLLTTDRALGKTYAKLKNLTPITTFLDQPRLPVDPDVTLPKLSVVQILTFVYAVSKAIFHLRTYSIYKVIAALQDRRTRQMRSTKSEPIDENRVKALVRSFYRLRPLLFSTRDACLLNSLSLLYFLEIHRVFPSWIFGVRISPFSAHCWIQHDEILLNDVAEHARLYSPIMRV